MGKKGGFGSCWNQLKNNTWLSCPKWPGSVMMAGQQPPPAETPSSREGHEPSGHRHLCLWSPAGCCKGCIPGGQTEAGWAGVTLPGYMVCRLDLLGHIDAGAFWSAFPKGTSVRGSGEGRGSERGSSEVGDLREGWHLRLQPLNTAQQL